LCITASSTEITEATISGTAATPCSSSSATLLMPTPIAPTTMNRPVRDRRETVSGGGRSIVFEVGGMA
jgi:hypothetical protein